MDAMQKKAATEKKMQEINPQSESFRQWARAMRGYMGASRSRHAIESARLKSVRNAGWRVGKNGRVEFLACADDGLNMLAKETARLQQKSVHERRRMLDGVQS